MSEKKIDNSPFLNKMENFEIVDGKYKKSRGDIKNVYRSLDNEFNFDIGDVEVNGEGDNNEQVEDARKTSNDMKNQGNDRMNYKTQEKDAKQDEKQQDRNIRTIKIDRKNLKKMFSSQFFTQTLTDDSSINSLTELKINKKYAILELFKTFFLIILFFLTSYFAFIYIYNNYIKQTHICGYLDMYNYKYQNEVRFISTVSNAKHYVFTGKFPFDVITQKLRKELLKNSMNEEIEKYNKENKEKENFEKIQTLDDHEIQIMSFMKYNNKMKCEKKIFDLYMPFYLKSTDVNLGQLDFVVNEVNYNFITNPYNVPEGRLHAEVANFMKKSESQNKICYITSYLNSLKNEKTVEGSRILSEEGNVATQVTSQITEGEKSNGVINKATDIISTTIESAKRYLKNGNAKVDQHIQHDNEYNSGSHFSDHGKSPKKKIIYMYDYYDNNFVDLLIAIYDMQYRNSFRDLKEYWEEIKQKFKIVHAEEIHLLEWYCLGINYNLIENNNQYKLNCVDLLK
ncbi:hypothetical protein, conserved [Plasmodium gonderi]|uniref:Uncharacterized protein n=1 Tax=Plasmodium gonderi TaxID=77519 RepID=A0A1Y1JG67_PLAGO|nr:hypothetical protein, conserved [Plasmodium gonderi]GAW79752.1 hypothetical protein, conserved [Plasmodium gonderi]